MHRSLSVPLAALSLVLVPFTTSVPARAGEPAEAPVIGSVAISTETGGLSGYLPVACTVQAEFTDETPRAGDSYAIALEGSEARGATPRTDGSGHPVEGAFSIGIPCGDLADGEHQVTVREYRGGEVAATSEPGTFSFRVIGHPRGVGLDATEVRGGGYALYAGRRYHLKNRGGWETNALISTQVWTSRRGSVFTSTDDTANRSGRAAVVSVDGARTMVTSFRIPRRLVGRWAWVSVLGRTGQWGADGVADYRYTWAPLEILPPKR